MSMIEIQSATFRPDMWRCMYELIDTEYPSGWGIDWWFYNYCISNFTAQPMAVVDTMYVHHNPANLITTHVVETSMELQRQKWKEIYGIELSKEATFLDFGPLIIEKKI